ncbi:MAG: DNA gyrase subunit A [Patescibacteria group bacterium]|nr:DNA gyrase subunit A [Patescibacteria group bacterium]
MKRAYLDYAMSVIVSRALPDVRDGLKPVHRRILYAMYRLGLNSQARFSKSAGVVGEVLGKFHPHGDSPVYEALVRLAQEFSMRYPLVRGQGNFGSIDGDPPAAMRYTEVKLNKIADEMLGDIDKDTVPWQDNFDGRIQEPKYLPAKLPNLLLMGAEGIAVGMATKTPPHNLTEVCDAIIALIETSRLEKSPDENAVASKVSPTPGTETVENTEVQKTGNARKDMEKLVFDATVEDLMHHVKGPDFPTYGTIYGTADIRQAYSTGRGKIMVRGVIEEEEVSKGKTAIIIRELPYQVNKANLVEKIAHLVMDKKITGISDLRDESDRDGIRVVIELKRDASLKKVVNNLYKYTELQTSFPVNMVCLVDGVPQTLSLKSILEYYIKHRVGIVINRTEFELKQAKARAHILEGLLIAIDNIDEVIEIIRKSPDEPAAKSRLMERFGLSAIQSQAILDMQLKRLTGLERDKIEEELRQLKELIVYLESLLTDIFQIMGVIKEEVRYLKDKYGDKRRTKVVAARPGEISDEQLIENKEVIVVLTKEGYIKQVPRETFKVQGRGGKGVAGIETKENDNVFATVVAHTHDHMMYFTNMGRVFLTRVWDIPQGSRTSKGKAIVNLLNLRPEERVTSVLGYSTDSVPENMLIVMVTKKGTVKKTPFKDFSNIKSNGLIAIKLDEGDELLMSKMTDGNQNVILTSRGGKTIVFPEAEIRATGRSSMGVRGMILDGDDEVTAADVFNQSEYSKSLLVISERGIGKRCALKLLKGQHRGGKGVRIAPVDKRTGKIVFVAIIGDETAVMITSKSGQVVQIPLGDIPSYTREAKGVILMRFSDTNDSVVSAAFI